MSYMSGCYIFIDLKTEILACYRLTIFEGIKIQQVVFRVYNRHTQPCWCLGR